MIRPRYPQVLPLTNGRGKLIEIMNMTEITPISSCHEERLRGTSSSSKLNRSNTPNPVPSQPCPVTAQLLSFAWYHQVNFPLLTLSGHLSHVLFFFKKIWSFLWCMGGTSHQDLQNFLSFKHLPKIVLSYNACKKLVFPKVFPFFPKRCNLT